MMDVRIRTAAPSDLSVLHALASAAMVFDRFSPDLLAEKLFFNPHPGRDEYTTLLAEADGRPVGMMQHVVRASEAKAWLGLFAVTADRRRRGLGRRLYDAALAAWRERGVRTVDTLTIPANYLVPGIDPRYTPACCFVESLGFVQRAAKSNMVAYLDSEFDTRRAEEALREKRIEIRRAADADSPAFERFFGKYFGEDWLAECGLAMQCRPPAVHLALRGGEVIAFSAHSSMNREWGNFGPMGTADDARGLGLGRVLLHRCMADLKAAGHATAVIPWIGPYPFYCRHLNCHIERVFWQYRLEL
ncbi:MAG: GNAT family N-acetyltransferase, partial [Planctomycetes bacterium]|nr:GNAT family N-acetyltransferase [Planctomycetota bacterium]